MDRRSLMLTLAAGAVLPAMARAAPALAAVRILSGGAVQPGLDKVVARFNAGGGHAAVEYTPSAGLRRRIDAGELPEILIAPSNVMTAAVEAGRVRRADVRGVGRVGIGVIVPAGGPAPDIGSAESLTAALRQAKAVVFNQEGSTGAYLAGLLERLGLARELAGRIERPSDGEAVIRRIDGGAGQEIGFAALTEIRLEQDEGRARKLRLVGPLPAGMQNYTAYEAAPTTPAPSAAAAAFLALLKGEGAALMRAAGVE